MLTEATRKYAVTYATTGCYGKAERGTAYVMAYDARDAAEQVRINRQSLIDNVDLSPSRTVRIVEVKPAER